MNGNLVRIMLMCPALALTVPSVQAQTFDDQSSLVWFVGVVTDVVGGQASIDLGEVHGFEKGDTLAVFRPVDDHFEAKGVLTLEVLRPVMAIARRTNRFDVQPGDQVVSSRTLLQLGTVPEFRDEYLKRKILSRSRRNGYSNVQLDDEATLLHRFAARQPKWVRNQSARDNELQPVAGMIRSKSIDSSAQREIEPLLEQVLEIHEYAAQGVPVDQCLPADWLAILTALDPHAAERSAEPAVSAPGAAADATTDPSPSTGVATDAPVPVDLIRRHVTEVMFTRSEEQRHVAVLLCAALEHFTPRHEELWISQQLRNTQFVSLATDPSWLQEFELVMQRVRQDNK